MSSTTAIVMASVVAGDPVLAGASPNGSKSLIPLRGRPAVSYVIDNLRACDEISRVVLVSDRATYESVSGTDYFVEASQSEAQSVMDGVRASEGSDRCLIMTGDLPLACPDAIRDLLSCAPDSDLVYPVVAESDVLEVYPSKEATYLGVKEGRFTGSSSLLFRPEVALSREKMITDVLNARRNPKVLLGMLGPGLAMKMLLGSPSLLDFENQLSRALNVQCRVFISHYPELVFSIDSHEDIRHIESELA